jgi:ribosomal-protein-alanine N-acetyltransferase
LRRPGQGGISYPVMPAHTPESSIRLRPGRPGDLDALLALEQSAFLTDHLSRRSFRNFVASPNAALIVAEEAGRTVGYALVLFRPRSAVARLYSIAAAVAGRGIGPMLLSAAEKAAVRRGCDNLRLEVHEKNAVAIRRYRKSGYQLFGRHLSYYDDRGDALRFAKRIGKQQSTGRKDSPSPVPSVAR